jgi:hypothetical protein
MPPTIPLQPPPTVTIRPASERKDNEKLSTIALFAVVYLVDNHIIRKIPWSQSEEDLQPILREALIYDTLGNRPRIAKWPLRDISDYIEIKYHPYGDLVVFGRELDYPRASIQIVQQILDLFSSIAVVLSIPTLLYDSFSSMITLVYYSAILTLHSALAM